MSVINLEINGAILIFGDSSGLRIKKELLHNNLHVLNVGSNPERIDLITQIDPDLVILNISFPIPGDLKIFRIVKSNLVRICILFCWISLQRNSKGYVPAPPIILSTCTEENR